MMDRFEVAARTYCKLAGLDPEHLIGHSIEGSGAYYRSPRWQLLMDDFKDMELRMLALEAAQRGEAMIAASQGQEGGTDG